MKTIFIKKTLSSSEAKKLIQKINRIIFDESKNDHLRYETNHFKIGQYEICFDRFNDWLANIEYAQLTDIRKYQSVHKALKSVILNRLNDCLDRTKIDNLFLF